MATMIAVLAVPFSAIGAVWYLYLAGYHIGIAVWVGLIALLGVDAETGDFMLLSLDLSFEEARRNGRMRTAADLREAIMNGAAKHLRPKFMTFANTHRIGFPSCEPWAPGAYVMKRIAAPEYSAKSGSRQTDPSEAL
jgi:Cu(I)/Ag(I) efflux system membrane protein CusA/SilA